MSDVRRLVRAMIAPLQRRVMMTVGRAVLRAIDDSGSRQTAQIEALRGEVRDAVERMQQYGFTSVPLPGADGAVVFVAGNREQGIIVATEDRRYRLTGLEGGEVAIYDDQGQKVHLTRDGIVVETSLDLTATVGGNVSVTATGSAEVTAASVSVTAPTVTIAGDLSVTGTITGTVDVVGGGKSLKTHVHGGVAVGGSNTGAPV